jgi:hypothetical protein
MPRLAITAKARPLDQCLVEFLNCVGVISTAKRQWLIREFPKLPNYLQQHIESDLTIFDCLSDAVFHKPSRSIVFLAGAGSSIPAASFRTHLISWRFSQARSREARKASSSSRSSWTACGAMDMTSDPHVSRFNSKAQKGKDVMPALVRSRIRSCSN